jgi:thioredoxin reductase (NADPH)
VEAIKVHNVKTGEDQEFPTEGVFVFIGHSPNSDLFEEQLSIDDNGYILTNKLLETSIPGVFAAGEVADPHFRQVITSAGMGAAAAIQATRYLEDLKGSE